MEVRQLTAEDTRLVRSLLGDAFAEDPVMTYMQPDKALIGRYFEAVFCKQYVKHGLSVVTRDHTGAALWLPPGTRTLFPPLSYIIAWTGGFLRQRQGVQRIVQATRNLSYVERVRPGELHYYLHALGVVGNVRGQGVGSILLRKRLAVCDREKVPAYLECSNEKNLPFYNRHGFRVTGDCRVAPGGPRLWFMLRKPDNRIEGKE